ncbi:MAG TPA: hypothetical protein VFM29_05610 [Vicinamibacteria bacterium]|nr:hypothetical protein [Vicinamibacteria bacterium]
MRVKGYLFLVLVPLIPWLQWTIDRRVGERQDDGVLYLRTGEQVRKLSPGFEDLMADIYWLRAVQYNGRQRLKPGKVPFTHLDELVDITTTLDPRLEIAYWYGAVFLSEDLPYGKGSPQEGRALLEKGARNLPHSWRIRQYLAFVHYLYLKDPRAAAATLVEGSRLPGAPFWLETLAASILVEGDERDRARSMWTHLYEQAQDQAMKENARYNLQRLDALDVVDAYNEALRAEARRGRVPQSMAEARALVGGRLPEADPTGVPYAYDRDAGTVAIAPRSPLWRSR